MGLKIRKRCLRGLQAVAGKAGLDVYPRRPDHHYVSRIYGRSAHKHVDISQLPGFADLAREAIETGRCQLYYDRLYTIFQALMNVSRQPGALNGITTAEVGVYRGGTSWYIASLLREIGLTRFRHFACDTFEGHDPADLDSGIDTHRARNFADTGYDAVCTLLAEFPQAEVLKGRIQDTCRTLEGHAFHFVHLDVDIYAPTRFALDFFDRRMRPGGVIVLDDYGFASCRGVERAVQEFLKETRDYTSFHHLTGQCVLVRHREEMD